MSLDPVLGEAGELRTLWTPRVNRPFTAQVLVAILDVPYAKKLTLEQFLANRGPHAHWYEESSVVRVESVNCEGARLLDTPVAGEACRRIQDGVIRGVELVQLEKDEAIEVNVRFLCRGVWRASILGKIRAQ